MTLLLRALPFICTLLSYIFDGVQSPPPSFCAHRGLSCLMNADLNAEVVQ